MEIKIEQMLETDLNLINMQDFDDFWNINILSNDLHSPLSYYIVAKCKNEILGFAGLNFILDEAHVANIAVRKDKRNLKIGSMLLESLIAKAKQSSVSVTLEVNENNLVAIHLYEKYGFKLYGKRKKYYNNQFDAYIMTKIFN